MNKQVCFEPPLCVTFFTEVSLITFNYINYIAKAIISWIWSVKCMIFKQILLVSGFNYPRIFGSMANITILSVLAFVMMVLECIFSVISFSTSYWGKLDDTVLSMTY